MYPTFDNLTGNGRSLTATSSSESTNMSVWSSFSERPKEPDAFSDTTTPVWEMPQASSQFTPGLLIFSCMMFIKRSLSFL